MERELRISEMFVVVLVFVFSLSPVSSDVELEVLEKASETPEPMVLDVVLAVLQALPSQPYTQSWYTCVVHEVVW
jgi:hypothetical protein